MKESTILKTAFIISVIGIMMLYLFSDGLVVEETRLNETIEDGGHIKVIGKVSSINVKTKIDDENGKTNDNKTYTILNIQQTNTIAVYVEDALNISKGTNIEVIGKIENGMLFSDEIKTI